MPRALKAQPFSSPTISDVELMSWLLAVCTVFVPGPVLIVDRGWPWMRHVDAAQRCCRERSSALSRSALPSRQVRRHTTALCMGEATVSSVESLIGCRLCLGVGSHCALCCLLIFSCACCVIDCCRIGG